MMSSVRVSPSRPAAAGDDPHSVMAGLVPAVPMLKGPALHWVGITGTSPVMMGRGCLRPFPG
jgi:hypothetical protein